LHFFFQASTRSTAIDNVRARRCIFLSAAPIPSFYFCCTDTRLTRRNFTAALLAVLASVVVAVVLASDPDEEDYDPRCMPGDVWRRAARAIALMYISPDETIPLNTGKSDCSISFDFSGA
jgi:hypothetical protein